MWLIKKSDKGSAAAWSESVSASASASVLARFVVRVLIANGFVV